MWNMTQSVQLTTQRTLLREAWIGALHRTGPWLNYRDELRSQTCGRNTLYGHVRARWPHPVGRRPRDGVRRWPLYLSITLPKRSPMEWRGIIGSRPRGGPHPARAAVRACLMTTMLPQLEACGFFPRPLCTDFPSFLILVWPADATWSTYSQATVLLPLRERLMPCLFAMIETAYSSLWHGPTAPRGYSPPWTPPQGASGETIEFPMLLRDLLPDLDIQLSDL